MQNTGNVKPSKLIDKGGSGAVYAVKGSNTKVIKKDLPGVYKELTDHTVRNELEFYNNNKDKFLVPSKAVRLKNGELAILRPKLNIILTGERKANKDVFTKQFIEKLRKQIIVLTYKGYLFSDSFQLGMNKAKQIFQYDLGGMDRINMTSLPNIRQAFSINNKAWDTLGVTLGKQGRIGKIERSKELDKKYLKI